MKWKVVTAHYLVCFVTLLILALHVFLAIDMCDMRREASREQALQDFDEYLEDLVEGLEPPCEFYEEPDGTVHFRHG